jgi:hypothetical protein
MSGAVRRLLSPIIGGRHARLPGSAGLRGVCLTALIALVAQFGLGMILNLYVPVPSSDAHAGYIQEVRTAPFALTVHAVLGIFLICAAVVLLVRAIGVGNRVMTSLAATGLGAILGAFAAGEAFVRNGQSSTSLWMAILTGIALVCYISALGLIGVVPGQPALDEPYAAPLPRQRPDSSGPMPRLRPAFPATGPQPYAGPPARPQTRRAYPPPAAGRPYPPPAPAPGRPYPRAAAQRDFPSREGRPVAPRQGPPFRNPPNDDVWGRGPW